MLVQKISYWHKFLSLMSWYWTPLHPIRLPPKDKTCMQQSIYMRDAMSCFYSDHVSFNVHLCRRLQKVHVSCQSLRWQIPSSDFSLWSNVGKKISKGNIDLPGDQTKSSAIRLRNFIFTPKETFFFCVTASLQDWWSISLYFILGSCANYEH